MTALDGLVLARRDGSLHCVAIDSEDYARVVAAGPWHVSVRQLGQKIYAARNLGGGGTEYLHRFVLGLVSGDKREIDHIDNNGLHNCKSNLRIVSRLEQKQNVGKKPGTTSRFRGVHWHRKRQKWCAQIQLAGYTRHLGLFIDEEAAARVAQEAREKFFTHAVEERHPIS